MAAKIWRGERVREASVAFWGRNAWTLTLPFLAFAAVGWAIPEPTSLVAGYLAVELAVYAVLFVALLALALPLFVSTKRLGPTTVELTDEGLQVGEHLVPRAELATAWAIQADELEVITHAGDELRLTFQDPQEMAAVGTAIRAAADRSRSYALSSGRIGMRTMRKALGAYLPVTTAGVIVGVFPATFWLLPLAAAVSWGLVKGTPRARFGADGVSIEGRFRRRFVPYREIAAVEVKLGPSLSWTVRVRLEDGSRVRVLGGLGEVRARLVGAMIEEGVAMVGLGEDAGAVMTDLQADATEEELLRRLLGVAQAGRYRDAAVDAERLQHLVRNPAAPPGQRIAAAIALRESPRGRAQLRVAAEVSAEPEVRAAFEALAEEELDEARSRALLKRIVG